MFIKAVLRTFTVTAMFLVMWGCQEKAPVRNQAASAPSTTSSSAAPGDHNFIIRMYGSYPAKFKDKEINIYVEGKRIESRKSKTPLRELRFSLDKTTLDAATAGKSGRDKRNLTVTVRLEPLSFQGKSEVLPAIFDIRNLKKEHVVSWGTTQSIEDEPIQEEDTNQDSRIN